MTEDILALIKDNVIQGRVTKDDEGFEEGVVGQPGVSELTEKALASGIGVGNIISRGLTEGMNIVGQKFETKEYFIPDMLASAEAVDIILAKLRNPIGVIKVFHASSDRHATVEHRCTLVYQLT
ncbi:unnamed protein product [marine sediment metagenome]|uniref:B12-binding N-terminal domain-containing protein n=1 Tax=marine sediment metagenome TaxID=412755 RepID=X1K9X4_9ZZZZ